MIFFQKIIEYINFFPTEDYLGLYLFIYLFTYSVKGTTTFLPPLPYGTKLLKHRSKLQSDNSLILKGRNNLFATLLPGESR